MKILYIAHERLLGGASFSLATLAEEMKNRGHDVAVIVPFYFSPLAKDLRKKGIKTYWVFFGWWMIGKDWPKLLKLMFQIVYALEWIPARIISYIVKKNCFQIIHSNSSTIDIGSRAAVYANCIHVWHFREFADLFYGLEFIEGRKKSLEKISEKENEVIFTSGALSNYYYELQSSGRTHVIYNGVSDQYLNLHEHNNEKIVFLIAGNLHKNKRQDLVLQAVKILKEEGIPDFTVWIAGGSGSLEESKQYEQQLIQFIDTNRLSEVKMLGRISNMNEIRRKADVEIVASHFEAFGRVTVESMLSANPVIASDSGANPELIEEGKNGWLFEAGNAEMLAEKMKYLISNPELIEQAGKYAYQFAKDRFLSEKNTEQIEMVYDKLLKR